MAKVGNKLTARQVETAKHPGGFDRPHKLADGAGLFLQISSTGAKSWLLRFTLNGKTREMGLGPAGKGGVSLADARDLARAARDLARKGVDPIEKREDDQRMAEVKAAGAEARTFKAVAEAMLDDREGGWKNAKHRQQWRSTLATYAYPMIGEMDAAEIGTDDVLRVLRPIWTQTPETASRLRGRIEATLSAAKARGLRSGENPAAWRGHLDALLPSPRRTAAGKAGHHSALAWQDTPAFLAELRSREGISARALEFVILTAARTGEVLGARWGEIDLDGAVWTIPAERMKAGKEHRVPLSTAALAVLRPLAPMGRGSKSPIFAGQEAESSLSQMALLMLTRRMAEPENVGDPPVWADGRTGDRITPHGFRSSFRDWASEATDYPSEVIEMALAHTIKNKVEAAYRRGDLFEKRRALMEDWARHCISAIGPND